MGKFFIRMAVSLWASRLFFSVERLTLFRANAANFQVLFYLPVYFQSVRGDSAIVSGVYTLPFVCFYSVGSFLSGYWISKTGRPLVMEIAAPLIALIGVVLFYEMDISTSKAWYVGAQIPFGLGIGLGIQAPITALQALTKPSEVAAIVGILFSE